jgi:membrane peptidoglycan carboxypeptidase
MPNKKDQPVSSFHDLMEANNSAPEYKKPRRLTAWAKFFTASAAVAVAASCLTVPVGFAIAAGTHTGIDYWDNLKSELSEDDTPLPQRTVLLDRNGKEFAQFYSENRQNVDLKNVAPVFIDALIATEDSRFYETHGFDGIAIARSFVSTTSGDQKQGASGITQQLVKNFQILNAKSDEDRAKVQSRSLETKLQELKYAVNLEKEYSKEELLQMYVNTVYFGNNAYGISAAAQTYFSTTPDKLTLQQAATLVGVINNPTIYNPISAPDGSDERKNTVLYRLLATNKITKEEHDKAVATKTELKLGSTENGCGQSAYPYYCDLVRQEILSNPAFGPDAESRQAFLYRGGVTITTAMDPKAMDLARQAAVDAYGDDNRVASGIATVQPGTGQILGVGQNRSWGNGPGQTEMIYATSKRQTGSSFKPFTLATALEQGIPASTQMVSNSYYTPPAGYTAPEGGFSNFGFYNYGSVDAYKATKMSMNIWYVKLMERTGVVPVAQFANRLGLTIPTEGEGAVNPATLSLTLGAWESSPIQMANAYATFASGGTYCNPVSILSAVRSSNGEKVPVSDPDCHQAIMPNVANTVTDVMKGVLASDGTAPNAALAGGRPAAAKTGTTNGFADAWLVGYTPQYATAVWTGDPRGGAQYPLTEFVQYGQYKGGLSGDGSTASGPLWKYVMDGMHQGLPNASFPSPSSSVGAAVTARTIPNVTGLDINEAITVLQSYGYVPVLSKETSGDAKILAKNTVVSQNPAGGNNGSHKQEITLTLSPGSDTGMKISEKKDK